MDQPFLPPPSNDHNSRLPIIIIVIIIIVIVWINRSSPVVVVVIVVIIPPVRISQNGREEPEAGGDPGGHTDSDGVEWREDVDEDEHGSRPNPAAVAAATAVAARPAVLVPVLFVIDKVGIDESEL